MTINLHQISYRFSTRRYKQNWKFQKWLIWSDAHQEVTQSVCCVHTTNKNMVKIVLCYLSRHCFLKWKAIRYQNFCALFFQCLKYHGGCVAVQQGNVFCAMQLCAVGAYGSVLRMQSPGRIKLEARTAKREPNLLQPCLDNLLGISLAWSVPKLCTGAIWESQAGESQNHAGEGVSN